MKYFLSLACALSVTGCDIIYYLDDIRGKGGDSPAPVAIVEEVVEEEEVEVSLEFPPFFDDLFNTPMSEPNSPTIPVDKYINWVAPHLREDESSLALSEIHKFVLYYGMVKHEYTVAIDIEPHQTGYNLKDFPSGRWWLAMTTVDVDGRESTYSDAIRVRIP